MKCTENMWIYIYTPVVLQWWVVWLITNVFSLTKMCFFNFMIRAKVNKEVSLVIHIYTYIHTNTNTITITITIAIAIAITIAITIAIAIAITITVTITIHAITLHDMTWHDMTLHYITYIYVYIIERESCFSHEREAANSQPANGLHLCAAAALPFEKLCSRKRPLATYLQSWTQMNSQFRSNWLIYVDVNCRIMFSARECVAHVYLYISYIPV